jgi:hypothetical protein
LLLTTLKPGLHIHIDLSALGDEFAGQVTHVKELGLNIWLLAQTHRDWSGLGEEPYGHAEQLPLLLKAYPVLHTQTFPLNT